MLIMLVMTLRSQDFNVWRNSTVFLLLVGSQLELVPIGSVVLIQILRHPSEKKSQNQVKLHRVTKSHSLN